MKDYLRHAKLEEYLSLRHALGVPLGERELPLREFVNYLDERAESSQFCAQLAIDWIRSKSSTQGIRTQYLRLILVRSFLRHLKASRPEIEIPDLRLVARPRRPLPFVFTTAQLNRLLRKAGANRQQEHKIHPFTLQTIVGLMCCSGLRPGEVVKLQIDDMSIEQNVGRLLIRSSKFKKSRWVPLHFTAYNRLVDYMEWREQLDCVDKSVCLFICNDGKPINYQRLRRRFNDVIRDIGVMPKSNQLPPTLHSLRHTFAVRRLRQWYAWKMNTQKLLPILSVYLGHKSLESSYWYLSATPELMSAASQLFEKYATGEV